MEATLTRKPSREELKPGEVLCDHCTAKCCRYLLHDRASVFTEDGTWYILVHTVCKHLQPDNRCGIYETRPEICREYTTENCEYDDDWVYDRYFETPEQVEEYAEAVLQRPGKSIRGRKPPLLPIV